MTTVEDLLPYLRQDFIFASSAASPHQVRSLMLLNRISRVPIIDGIDGEVKLGRKCRGIVRMRAFFDRAVNAPFPGRLDELMSEAPPAIDVTEPLFRAVEQLRGRPEVLVRNSNKFLTHILTPRGLADWWHAYSQPFLVLEELETALRDMLRPFEGVRLLEAVDVGSVEELNPAHYHQACAKFGQELPALTGLDEDVVRGILVSFAEQRNKLMHFRLDARDSLSAHLRRFSELEAWIRRTVPPS